MMSESGSIILHLGLHKTATGTLQRQFFPACDGINLLTSRVPGMRRFIAYVTRTDPLYFDRAHAHSMVGAVADPRKPNVISNESFSGPPYAGVIEGGLDHRTPVLQNLRAVFPHARAILVLRRQDTWARSLYRQYLKSGGTRTMRRFFGLCDAANPPLFSMDRFLYSPYVQAVHGAFPAGVLILTFEEFAADQQRFLGSIAEFIGCPLPRITLRKENVTSLGPLGMEVTRYLNHLFRSLLNPGGLIPGYPITRAGQRRRVSPVQVLHDRWPWRRPPRPWSEPHQVGQEILQRVLDDNRRLDERFGLDLARYGYY